MSYRRYRVEHVSDTECRLVFLQDVGPVDAGHTHVYYCPVGGGYVRRGKLRRQVCNGLGLSGSTLSHYGGPLATTIRREARKLVRALTR